MRDIKFEVWDVEMKHMIGWEEIQKEWEAEGYNPSMLSGDHYIPREYTGLKDKNGKEIYEGDITNYGIVKWHDNLTWDGGGSSHPGFYFDKTMAWENGELDYHTGFDEEIEVIGNIYEQKELLGGE